ncbi:hypothetical protein HDU92_006255 [Lobulomyces angularis]|nr:hypothetical protein HDU92_006255 [Lobulomyces angularis]
MSLDQNQTNISSEEILNRKYDKCISDTVIKAGLGLSFGIGLSFLFFKRKAWPVALSVGFGTGMAYDACLQKLFQINDSTISKKVKSPWTKKEGELLIGNFRNSESEVVTKTKIAAFDLDHTLTKTKGKHVFHKNADDWEFLYSNVPFKLKKLVEEGHEIVLFSNQTGLEKDGKETSKMKVFKDKVEKVAMALGVDFVIFASLGYGKYRKPLPGMFYEYQELFHNNPEPVDTTNSFFVGDAAGRSYGEIKGKAKKDFSDTDL